MGEQFLEVIDAAEAHRRLWNAVRPEPLGCDTVALADALGRILAVDILSPIDVPGFDRSNVDGFAVRAADTFGAEEGSPIPLRLSAARILTGTHPCNELEPKTAVRIVTGGMIPRGADAVVMVEHTNVDVRSVAVSRAVTPASNISFAGSDIARGEVVVRAGTILSARETGTIAALGITEVTVQRKPRVAVFSTGNEIVAPGAALPAGMVYDSNLRMLSDMVRELGCEAIELGVVADDEAALTARLRLGLEYDAVIFSGGTSKGEGDLGVQAVRAVAKVLCHGVALKPGKPLCLAVDGRKPIAVLPGFPTSAVFTFHEFIAPVLLALAGAPPRRESSVDAVMPVRCNTEKGRAEFLLVSLLAKDDGLVAYPLGKGSGSVTTFSRADGFITLGRQQEYVEAGESVRVRLISRELEPADLVVIGSHCVGLDLLLSIVRDMGFTAKTLTVGSQAGLAAAARGECDIAGIHLRNPDGVYNVPFLTPGLGLVPGYGRMQGVVYRDREPALATATMVNRNRGSGTRILIDELLAGAKPPGYHFEARSHNAVAAAIAQNRADWGVAIKPVADAYGLKFRPLCVELYDFVVPDSRRERPAVRAFIAALASGEARQRLAELGFVHGS
jgi:putative molybdopterin biosynthesis protein